MFFFGTVAGYPTAPEYKSAVTTLTDEQLEEQVWELARHATMKAKYARLTYMAVFGFLLLWGAARVSLSLAT